MWRALVVAAASSSRISSCASSTIYVSARRYAAPSGKVVPGKEDKSFVESDAEKLAKNVCINFYIQGEEPGPAIQDDSEYPKWLFELDLRPLRELEDMNPETDGWLYWRELRKRQMSQARRSYASDDCIYRILQA